MSVFPGARNIAVLGGQFVASTPGSTVNIYQGQSGISSATRELSAAVAHTAMYDSAARFDAPRCHRNTRVKKLDDLELWILGKVYNQTRLIWFCGSAGAGKSAIMQSIVERCVRNSESMILGTFFFCRSDASRNFAEVLIPTLAYQLARTFPEVMNVLGPIISRDPLIFKASFHTQAYELLVRPLRYLIDTGAIHNTNMHRSVFVIDGLDECINPEKQALIINAVVNILSEHEVPVLFVIASRPEVAIRIAFQRETARALYSHFMVLNLDDDEDAEADIRQFIEDSFLDIVTLHPHMRQIKSPWPDPRSVDTLVRNASGHFIYAAVAMKFIASHFEHPTRALRVIKGLESSRTGSPFAELDTLYLHILTSAKFSSELLAILRFCFLTHFPPDLDYICAVLKMREHDVYLFLSDVEALVTVHPQHPYMQIKHASLGDFLKSEERAQGLYVAPGDYHASFLTRYFELLDEGSILMRLTSLVIGARESPPEDGGNILVWELCKAIDNSKTNGLLDDLIRLHSPRDVRDFCNTPHPVTRTVLNFSLSKYRTAVRAYDKTLYLHHFSTYMDILSNDLDQFSDAQINPLHRTTPALFYSFIHSPSALATIRDMTDAFSGPIHRDDYSFLWSLPHFIEPCDRALYLQATVDGFRRSSLYNVDWSLDLAAAVDFVLKRISILSKTSITPSFLFGTPHRRWLRRTKPAKFVSIGSPKLASCFYSHLLTTRRIIGHRVQSDLHLRHNNYINRLSGIKSECFLLLQGITLLLPKAACTTTVATYCRKSLPKIALLYPKLMKRALREMDAYVLHWEGSFDGVLEQSRLLSVNDVD